MGGIDANSGIVNQLLTPAFYADAFANRPPAGYLGRMFISTDTFAFYRDNGTGYDLIGGPGTGTVTGSGTTGTIPLWSGAMVIGDSTLSQSAGNLTATGTITAGGFTGNLTGNITGSAPAGLLTGNTLAAGITTSSINTLNGLGNGIVTAINGNGTLTTTPTSGGGSRIALIDGTINVILGKTLNIDNSLEFTATDGAVLGIGSGGTLGTNAYTSGGFVPTSTTINGKALTGNIILVLASADFANSGTTTTVLHGNAAGSPSWSAVSLTADVSGILPIANGGTGNATGLAATATALATARLINGVSFNGTADITITAAVPNSLTVGTGLSYNAGTTYDGSAARTISVNTSQNISTLSNLTSNGLVTTSGGTGALSITVPGTGVLTAMGVNVGSAGAFITFNGNAGTPSALVGTNITGTAAGLTTGNVTTNANLTGPITSAGNATSIASQTGTGTTFAMSASPAFTGTWTGTDNLTLTKVATGSVVGFAAANTSTSPAGRGFGIWARQSTASVDLLYDNTTGTGFFNIYGATSRTNAITGVFTSAVLGMSFNGTVVNMPGLTASQAVFSDASKNLVSNAISGTGSVVMTNSPTLVTPALGAATYASLAGGNIALTSSSGQAFAISYTYAGGIYPFKVEDQNFLGVYIGSENTFNFNFGKDADSAGYINYIGYNGGITRWRDTYIGDGKQGVVASFLGSGAVVTLTGLAGSGSRYVQADATGILSATGVVPTVSGTSGTIPVFTGANAIGNSNFLTSSYMVTPNNNNNQIIFSANTTLIGAALVLPGGGGSNADAPTLRMGNTGKTVAAMQAQTNGVGIGFLAYSSDFTSSNIKRYGTIGIDGAWYLGNDDGSTVTYADAGIKFQVLGNIKNSGSIQTGAPSGGTAGAWKFGIKVVAVSALDTTGYLQADIAGTAYKLALIT